MKSGPRTGTKYSVDRQAIIESPKDVYKAGRAGTGSIKGRNMNHSAVGNIAAMLKVESRGLDCKAGIFLSDPSPRNLFCSNIQKVLSCAQFLVLPIVSRRVVSSVES